MRRLLLIRLTAILILAAAAALWIWSSPSGEPASGARTPAVSSVLLITIDTLRADRVGVGLTPAIDTLAARGVSFTHARTAVPLTLPSHATILTGRLPPAHGVRENGAGRLPDGVPTLATLLRARGYRTAAFVGAYVLDRRFGLGAGFDTYDDRIARDPGADVRLEAERSATAVVDAALGWTPGEAPFFLWVHLYDPHAPYTPPPAFLERARGDAYNGEVAYADAEAGRLIRELDARGALRHTLVVVAGDHGESLGDHRERTHGMLLYEKALRVPLVFAGPGPLHAAFPDRPVTLADVAPTVLAAIGLDAPPAMQGVNLFASAASAERETYSETRYPRAAGWNPLYALSSERWKLIDVGSGELYDLARDPDEAQNVASTQAAIVTAMRGKLAPLRESTRAQAPAPAAAGDVAERLRALGYVAGSPGAASDASGINPATVVDAWAEFEEALSLVTARQLPRAIAILEPLARAHPESPVFQSTYARALMQTGDPQRALAIYRTAVGRWPRDADLFHGLAVAAREAGRADEAVNAERAALVLEPDNALAQNGLGLLAAEAGRFGEATSAFEQATRLDPTNASYWTNLGNARRGMGEVAKAEAAYRKALDVDARYADAANGLGVVLVQTNRASEAIAWLERAAQSSPDFYEAKLNLGIAYQQAGRRADAAAMYRDVMQAPPRFTAQREAASKLLAALK